MPRQAAYWQSQCVEKLLRALIEHGGGVVGITHSLGELAHLLGREHPLYPAFVALEHLSSASTRTCYPAPGGRLFDVDTVRLAADAEQIRRLITDTRHHIDPQKT